MSVCLFAMHFHTVQANATKLCMAYPFVQGKVMTGFSRLEVGFGEVFIQFSGKPYKIFFDFSKNFEIFPIS